jgi:hypothetical protein
MSEIVYGLVDERDHSVFYVGITSDIYARFLQHLNCDGTNLAKDARVQELKASNVMLHMITLEIIKQGDHARTRESYWIHHFQHLGVTLLNQRLELTNRPVVPRRNDISSPFISWEDRRNEVQRLRSLGFKQGEILARLWHVKPGATGEYIDARNEYLKMIEEIIKSA